MSLDPVALDFSDSFAQAAFRALFEINQPLTATTLAAHSDTDKRRVAEACDALRRIGRAEFTEDGSLIGIYGLTLKPTEHRLDFADRQFFVWCALDAVGIPAALRESASITSECAYCRATVRFDVKGGSEPDSTLVISWRTATCDSIRDQFCPSINFYCTEEHYHSSEAGEAAPDGFITLRAAAEIGRSNWGWAAIQPKS